MTTPKPEPIKGPLYVTRDESYYDPNGQTAVDYTLRDGDGFPVFFQDPRVLQAIAHRFNAYPRLVQLARMLADDHGVPEAIELLAELDAAQEGRGDE